MTHPLSRMALVLLAGSALAACATAPGGGYEAAKPNFPINKPPASQEPVSTAPTPESAKPLTATSPVQAAPLPPPVASAPMPPPSPSPRPVEQTVTRTIVTGKVVDADGPPQTYTVKAGDTVYAVARHFEIPPKQVAELNGLKEPYVIQPGQKLKGPGGTAKAYVVSSGDTIYAIARRFSVTPQALVEANDTDVSAKIRPGQRLLLPEGYKDRGPQQVQVKVAAPPAPAYSPPPAPPAPRPVTPAPAPTPYTPPARQTPPPAPVTTPPPATKPYTPLPPVQTPPAAATPPASSTPAIIPSAGPIPDAQIAALGKGRFVWPLRGDVISGFGPKAAGQRNDGVNLRASGGTPVRAAAAGDVVYAGDQVPGFGNLVLVKHADGWVTAYGHLASVDVKMQQKVTQGQTIGEVGSTGGVGEPQLHFEVRYAPTVKDRARPIDPQLVLPR